MNITPIEPLWNVFPTEATQKIGAGDSESIFGNIFSTAIEAVRETDAEKNKAEYLLAVGQLDNPAEYTLAATKAQVAVDLLVQLRNRAMDAYSEVMRISL